MAEQSSPAEGEHADEESRRYGKMHRNCFMFPGSETKQGIIIRCGAFGAANFIAAKLQCVAVLLGAAAAAA